MNDLLKPDETVEFDPKKYEKNIEKNAFPERNEEEDGIGEDQEAKDE